jgi:carboxylesterase
MVVVGLSMGALLGLRLAAERPAEVAGLVLLSPAAALGRGVVRWLRHPLRVLGALDARVAPLQAALARVLFGKGGSDIADAAVRAGHPGYRHVPLRALMQLLALQRVARADAPRVTQPVLMIHATQDHTCPVAAAQHLYARLGSRAKRLVLLEDSFHVVTVDRERARVQAEVREFLDGLAAAPVVRP